MRNLIIFSGFLVTIVTLSCSKDVYISQQIETASEMKNANSGDIASFRAVWPKRIVFGTRSYPGNCEGEVACCTGDRGICLIIEWLSDTISTSQAISELDTLQGIAEVEPYSADSLNFRILHDGESFDPEEQTHLNVNRDYTFAVEDSILTLKAGQYLLNYNGTWVFGRTKIKYEMD